MEQTTERRTVQLESSAMAGSNFSDALTRDQYYDSIRADDAQARPIKRLMLAVLEDAMRCYQTYAASRNSAHRRLFIEAERWLMARNADGVFSFENVCETLAIEPGSLRAGLRRWRLEQLDGMNPRRLARRSPVTSISRISAPLKRRRRKLSKAAAGDYSDVADAVDGGEAEVANHASDIAAEMAGFDGAHELEGIGIPYSDDDAEASVPPAARIAPRTAIQELALT